MGIGGGRNCHRVPSSGDRMNSLQHLKEKERRERERVRGGEKGKGKRERKKEMEVN